MKKDHYEGIFWGTFFTEVVGSMEFIDQENKISCKLDFGHVKKKPTDYFEGAIMVNGKPVSKVFGTYMGKLIVVK